MASEITSEHPGKTAFYQKSLCSRRTLYGKIPPPALFSSDRERLRLILGLDDKNLGAGRERTIGWTTRST